MCMIMEGGIRAGIMRETLTSLSQSIFNECMLHSHKNMLASMTGKLIRALAINCIHTDISAKEIARSILTGIPDMRGIACSGSQSL